MVFALVLIKIRFDDAMEYFPMFGTAGFLSAIFSVFFYPDVGILWGHSESGSKLGIQLLGFTVISFWMLVITWLLFFILKRFKILRMRKGEEILG